MQRFVQFIFAYKKTFGLALVVLATVVSFTFQNCGRATLGVGASANEPLPNPGTGVGLGTDASCPAGQVAIGLASSRASVCAPVQTFNADQCPSGYYLYGYTPTPPQQVQCVNLSRLNVPGTMCPYNQQMVAFTSDGTIACERMPGMLPSFSCEPGKWAIGIVGGAAVCLPNGSVSPNPLHCPRGHYLYDVQNGQAICSEFEWSNANPNLSCPAGQALVGLEAGQAVCQDLFPRPPSSPNQVCPAAQYAQARSNGQIVCDTRPEIDLVPLCKTGFYLKRRENRQWSCEPVPTGHFFNGICEAGKFLTGFENDQPVCANLQTNPNIPGVCPLGFYPHGISNGFLICLPYESNSDQVCTPTQPTVCTVPNGFGKKLCLPDGTGYTACNLEACLPGYYADNGACYPTVCTPGTKQSCPALHGQGEMVCKPNGQGYDACQVVSCEAGYFINNGVCVPQTCTPGSTITCADSPRVGLRTCNSEGSGYGTCNFTSCENGYTWENGMCRDTGAPVITFTRQPTDPNAGIAATIGFTVTDAQSGVLNTQCALDNAAFAACTSEVRLDNLSPIEHVFHVRAHDRAGNGSLASIGWRQTVCQAGAQQSCPVANGNGSQTCNAQGMAFSACAAISCDTGYSLSAGKCVQAPQGCALPWGGSIQNGQAIAAFAASSVPHGQNCESESRTCTNGVLSGSFGYSSCTVQPSMDCPIDGRIVRNGATVEAYPSRSALCGSNFEKRHCSNGTLTGSLPAVGCEQWGWGYTNPYEYWHYSYGKVIYHNKYRQEFVTITTPDSAFVQ